MKRFLAWLLATHHDSQTIIWARVQQIAGVTATVTLTALETFHEIDPSIITPLVSPAYVKFIPLVFFLTGRITEQLRKRPGSNDRIENQP